MFGLRSKSEFEKFLLEKNQKLDKFNLGTKLSDKSQKEVAFSEKNFATNFPATTAKQGPKL